jgi:dipeptidyl aminopeptidase/acylaminoacyl peptidase
LSPKTTTKATSARASANGKHTAASAARTTGRKQAVTPDDLWQLRQMFECRLSPDGTTLVTMIDEINRDERKKYMNLYTYSLGESAGGVGGKLIFGGGLRRFTRGEFNDRQPRFSPDGSLIAFQSNRSERSQVHLIHADGGESWKLTAFDGNVVDYSWSPDGSKVVCVVSPIDPDVKEREAQTKLGRKGYELPAVRTITRLRYRLDGAGYFPPERSELHVVDVASGKSKLLLRDGKDNYEPVFTPDGKWVVFTSNKSDDPDSDFLRADLWRIPAGGGKVEKIKTFDGPSESPSISPDGKWIAFRGFRETNIHWGEKDTKLWLVPIEGGKPRLLGAGLDRPSDNSCLNDTWGTPPTHAAQWSPDSSAVYSVVTDSGNTHVYRFTLDGKYEPVWTEPGVVLDFAIDFDGGKIYTVYSDQYNPGDLFVSGGAAIPGRQDVGKNARATSAPQQLTHVNDSWLSQRKLGKVHALTARTDGGAVSGWVVTPPDYDSRRKYPGILYIHGGPHMAYSATYFHEFQYLAGLGYVVFYCNPRGSTGYGEAHKAAISREWGNVDYKDILKFTDQVLKEFPNVDKDRCGVAGGSYGGYMTNWIIGHTHRFKAAVSDRCVSNFMSFFGSSDFGFLFHKGFGMDSKSPWEDRERFIEMSPISHMHKAKTPTLVIHQEDDLRCPIEQGEQVYVALKLKGVDTEMLRYPQESHGMSRAGRTDRRIHRLEAISGWMDKYLK